MKDEVALLATVTLLGVLQQAYFSPRVISARRAFRVSPPLTAGPPEFQRVYRAQGRGPLRPGLSVRAPALLPGLRSVRAAEAVPAVRERARPLAPGGAGGARPARPLPPRRAARRAAPTPPDAAAGRLNRGRRAARAGGRRGRRDGGAGAGEGLAPALQRP